VVKIQPVKARCGQNPASESKIWSKSSQLRPDVIQIQPAKARCGQNPTSKGKISKFLFTVYGYKYHDN